MGLKLSAVYQKSDFILAEISVKNPSRSELQLMESARDKWINVHNKGEDIKIETEGFVTTTSAQFKSDELDYANLFVTFITNSMEIELEGKNYGYDDEDFRDIE